MSSQGTWPGAFPASRITGAAVYMVLTDAPGRTQRTIGLGFSLRRSHKCRCGPKCEGSGARAQSLKVVYGRAEAVPLQNRFVR